MDGTTGKVLPFSQFDDGGDLVETAFMMQGLLAAREYFNQNTPLESALRDAITGLWEEVEWDWYRKNNSPVLYWHWSPNFAWQMNFPLRGFYEAQIVYILAAASPTHPVPAACIKRAGPLPIMPITAYISGIKSIVVPLAAAPCFLPITPIWVSTRAGAGVCFLQLFCTQPQPHTHSAGLFCCQS